MRTVTHVEARRMTPDQIIAWRNGLGLNRSQAAAALGLARNTLAAYEAGRARIPLYIQYACLWLAAHRP